MLRRNFTFFLGMGLTLGAARAGEIPRPAPEFAVLLPGGGQLLLSEMRGKVVLLAFVFTTCPHCQHMSEVLNKVYKDLGPRGFEPVVVAFNPMANMLVSDFAKQSSVSFRFGWSEREPVLSFLQHPPEYRFLVPQLVFVDRKGTIRLHVTGGDAFFSAGEEGAIRGEVEKLLAEPAALGKAGSKAGGKGEGANKTAKRASL